MLNIDKISSITTKSHVSFNGHHLSQNDKGEKTYKFYIPKVHYKDAILQLKKVQLDDAGNIITSDTDEPIEYTLPRGSAQVEVNPKDIDLSSSEALAYRFIIDGQEYTDKHRSIYIDDSKYNVADLPSCDVLQTPKTMYHIMPSSFNPKLKREKFINKFGEEIISDDRTAQVNHFVKFDSGIDDIIAKIPYIRGLGFRRLLSTPIFGQDNISNAGYWTANPFQITQRYGSIKDFDRMQIELFKNSMGFVADGAFTAEGLTGIHFRDILRHGKKSPFYRWFELDGNLKLGVLPDQSNVYENFDIRVVNSPVIWETDKNGKPTGKFGQKNSNYNPNAETFIQIYDKRLTSQSQLAKDEIFTSYDIKNPKDKDEITSWMDSVYPYAFPVKAADILQRAKRARSSRTIPAKEYLKTWANFDLVPAKKSSGLALWTGNKDMAKLRFSLPLYKEKEIMASCPRYVDGLKEVKKAQEATEDVQDYVVNIGKFWTNRTAKVLRKYIAQELSSAKKAADFKRIIDSKAGKNLPKEMRYITTQQIQNALNGEYKATKYLYVPKTIEKALKEYPMEALEVSEDLVSVFAYPSFKEKASEEIYSGVMKDAAVKILKELDTKNLPCGKLLEGEDIKRGQEKIVQLIVDDMSRFILLKGLLPALDMKNIFSDDKESLKMLKSITATRLCSPTDNIPEKEEQLLSSMKRNIKRISDEDIEAIAKYLKEKIGNINATNIKIADLLIDKAEAGLNWRIDAAKDVADMESFMEGDSNIEETWGFVADFWKRFNDGVKLHNTHAYKVGEFTDTAISSTEANDRFQNAGNLESKIIEQSGFTTQSNYNYLFDTLQRFYGTPAERFGGFNTNALDLIFNKFERGWNGVPGYLYSGNKNNISYSHEAVSNHDKQRITQTFAMNMPLAFLDEHQFIAKYKNDAYWMDISSEIYRDLMKSNMNNSCLFKAITNMNWEAVFKYTSAKNLAKIAAYNNAFAKASSGNKLLQKEFSNALDNLSCRRHPHSDNFFYKNFESTFDDILATVNAKYKPEVEKLRVKLHKELTEPARIRGAELARLMVALPANPTVFAGDELLEFGGEEKAKNVSLQNRNRLHWENAKYPHVAAYLKELSGIFNLRNDAKLTSLVNGDTLLLKNQGNVDGREITGMYRYNDKDDCIILMHNAGFTSSRDFEHGKSVSIPYIDLSNGEVKYCADGSITKTETAIAGLPANSNIKPGTVFVDALDTKRKFVIGKDGRLYSSSKKPVVLNHSVTILKRA